MKKQDGLMMTIASDDEVEAEDDSETEAAAAAVTAAAEAAARPALTKAGKKRQRQKAVARVKKGIEVDPSFSFDVDVSLGLAERQAVRGWDFKSEPCSQSYSSSPAACSSRLRVQQYECTRTYRTPINDKKRAIRTAG